MKKQPQKILIGAPSHLKEAAPTGVIQPRKSSFVADFLHSSSHALASLSNTSPIAHLVGSEFDARVTSHFSTDKEGNLYTNRDIRREFLRDVVRDLIDLQTQRGSILLGQSPTERNRQEGNELWKSILYILAQRAGKDVAQLTEYTTDVLGALAYHITPQDVYFQNPQDAKERGIVLQVNQDGKSHKVEEVGGQSYFVSAKKMMPRDGLQSVETSYVLTLITQLIQQSPLAHAIGAQVKRGKEAEILKPIWSTFVEVVGTIDKKILGDFLASNHPDAPEAGVMALEMVNGFSLGRRVKKGESLTTVVNSLHAQTEFLTQKIESYNAATADTAIKLLFIKVGGVISPHAVLDMLLSTIGKKDVASAIKEMRKILRETGISDEESNEFIQTYALTLFDTGRVAIPADPGLRTTIGSLFKGKLASEGSALVAPDVPQALFLFPRKAGVEAHALLGKKQMKKEEQVAVSRFLTTELAELTHMISVASENPGSELGPRVASLITLWTHVLSQRPQELDVVKNDARNMLLGTLESWFMGEHPDQNVAHAIEHAFRTVALRFPAETRRDLVLQMVQRAPLQATRLHGRMRELVRILALRNTDLEIVMPGASSGSSVIKQTEPIDEAEPTDEAEGAIHITKDQLTHATHALFTDVRGLYIEAMRFLMEDPANLLRGRLGEGREQIPTLISMLGELAAVAQFGVLAKQTTPESIVKLVAALQWYSMRPGITPPDGIQDVINKVAAQIVDCGITYELPEAQLGSSILVGIGAGKVDKSDSADSEWNIQIFDVQKLKQYATQIAQYGQVGVAELFEVMADLTMTGPERAAIGQIIGTTLLGEISHALLTHPDAPADLTETINWLEERVKKVESGIGGMRTYTASPTVIDPVHFKSLLDEAVAAVGEGSGNLVNAITSKGIEVHRAIIEASAAVIGEERAAIKSGTLDQKEIVMAILEKVLAPMQLSSQQLSAIMDGIKPKARRRNKNDKTVYELQDMVEAVMHALAPVALGLSLAKNANATAQTISASNNTSNTLTMGGQLANNATVVELAHAHDTRSGALDMLAELYRGQMQFWAEMQNLAQQANKESLATLFRSHMMELQLSQAREATSLESAHQLGMQLIELKTYMDQLRMREATDAATFTDDFVNTIRPLILMIINTLWNKYRVDVRPYMLNWDKPATFLSPKPQLVAPVEE